jgi:formate--tetrahydrofolate ligase
MKMHLTDQQIARASKMRPITQIAEKLGVSEDDLRPYGKYVAKLPLKLIDEEKIEIVSNFCQSQGVKVALCDAWAKGGEGAIELAQKVKAAAESGMSNFTPLYDFEWGIEQKIESIARKIYGAAEVEYSVKAKQQMRLFVKIGLDKLPVCIAKTQYSLSDDPKLINKPTGFTIKIREFDIAAGAGFIIPIAGTIMRMPGLPSRPAAENIDIDADGNITGLF